jgi:nucleoside-diphosphate-sugar epimerase
MSNVVVVGGSGVLGRRVIPWLHQAGHSVTALVRSAEAAGRLPTGPGVTTVVGDVWDRDFLRQELAGAGAVVMIATSLPPVADAGRAKAWRQNDRVRAVLAPQVAQLAREADVRRLVQESVMYVYADGGDQPITEESLVEPPSQAVACLTAEHGARRFRLDREDVAQSVVLRFALFTAADSDQAQMTLDWAKRGRALLLGDMHGYVTYVDVDDAAAAVVQALDVPSGIYNVGADPIIKADQLAVLSAVTGRSVKGPPAPVRLALSAAMPMTRALGRSLRLDSTKLREHGWKPEYGSAAEIWARVANGSAAT